MKNNLKDYHIKRNFNKTKEPYGKNKVSKNKLRFVVQHHIASKDHYDFRLEWNGVLKSWAVPKGPSYNPKDKRLAIIVEDHPYDYRNFEGVIPAGSYGAGPVMIWDEGFWEPLENIDINFNLKTIKLILHGHRLKGKWSLVHVKDDNWLLIKDKDSYKGFKNIDKYKTSVKTKRTMKEIEEGKKKTHTKKIDIKITNPDKVIFSKPKTTKEDIVNYYQKVADRMLPFVKNRILSTIRCPEGINGTCFFKKHLENINNGLGMIELESDSDGKNDYYYIKNELGIISEVQMNSFEFHVWGSKIRALEKPDIMIFDLDPDEGLSLSKIRQGVKDLKSILDEFKLKSFLKTSGGKGYHVVIPIKTKSWEEFRDIAKTIAELMEARWPDRYVSNVRKVKRKNKIFIDWIRNTRSSTSVAPYSIRTKNKPSVSMPIRWNELDKVKPDEILIEDAIKRLKRKDPWADFYN